MMEFTIARISACICGAMIVLILFNPVVDSFEDRAEDGCGENCEALGYMLDAFMSSETDESTVALNIMLPDNETRVSFDGCLMKVYGERGEWDYVLRNTTEADNGSYGSNDLLQLTKQDNVLVIRSL